jgi:hypothetical protein
MMIVSHCTEWHMGGAGVAWVLNDSDTAGSLDCGDPIGVVVIAAGQNDSKRSRLSLSFPVRQNLVISRERRTPAVRCFILTFWTVERYALDVQVARFRL